MLSSTASVIAFKIRGAANLIAFFISLAFLQLLVICWLMYRYSVTATKRQAESDARAKKLVDEAQASLKIKEVEDPLTVVERSEVIGRFQGSTIHRNIRLADGRRFTYESVAVQQAPGVYYSDQPNTTYVVIENCLLYREVKTA